MGSIKKLAEQALRIISGGNVRSSSHVHLKEMENAIVQAMTVILKYEAVNNNQLGDTPFSFVATYENIAVEELSSDSSKAKLPIQPANLPMGAGIWQVYKPDCPEDAFIPIVVGAGTLLQRTTHSGISELLGSEIIAYEPNGSTIKINRSKDAIGDVVTVQLLVVDPTTIGVDDPLPLPGDLEMAVVKEAVTLYGKRFPHDDSNDGKSN